MSRFEINRPEGQGHRPIAEVVDGKAAIDHQATAAELRAALMLVLPLAAATGEGHSLTVSPEPVAGVSSGFSGVGGFRTTVLVVPAGFEEGKDFYIVDGYAVASFTGIRKMIAAGRPIPAGQVLPAIGTNFEAATLEQLGKAPAFDPRRAALEDSARFGFTPPAPPSSIPAVIVDDIAGMALPELRPLVDRLTQLDADEREEIFRTYDLIDDPALQFIRRENPSTAAIDAAVMRHALVKAYGDGGELSKRLLRNVADVVERRLSGQRLRNAADRVRQPGA